MYLLCLFLYSDNRARDGAEAQERAPAYTGRDQSTSPGGARERRHHPRANPSEGCRTPADGPGVHKVRHTDLFKI